jgi:hypothetical protein
MGAKKKPQYRMTALKMTAIAGVDNPAQRPALAVAVMKRDDETPKAEPFQKDGYLTSETDGHSHLWDSGRQAGSTTSAITSTGAWHDHPYSIGEDGSVTIGASMNHTHTAMSAEASEAEKRINSASGPLAEAMGTKKNDDNKETAMPTELETAQSTITKNQAVIKHLMAVVALSAVHKAYYDALPEGERESFVAKSTVDRDLEVSKAAEANPVVYTATNGTVFRKNDDPRLAQFAKQADDASRVAAQQAQETAQLRLEKRADDPTEGIPHLCKTVKGRAALLAAVDAIQDETIRKDALEGLRAGELAIAGGFRELGGGGGPELSAAQSGEAQLQKMAEDRAKRENIPVPVAYAKNLDDNAEARAIVAGQNRARMRTV